MNSSGGPWPTTVLVAVVVISVTVLGVTHVLSEDWIERTLSAALGLALGHVLGARSTSQPADGRTLARSDDNQRNKENERG